MRFTPVVFLLVSIVANAQIKFEKPDWQRAVDKARKDKKLILVYVNTEWCEPCLEMELSVFQDPEVGELYNKAFVNVPFDAELYPGVELADRYDVGIFPTFLIVDHYGDVVHRGCGYMEKEGMQLLAKDALGPNNLKGLQKRFSEGERSVELITSYTELLESACMDKGPFVRAYFKQLPSDQWITPSTWAMINLNVTDPNSQEFEFLTTYRDRYTLQFGKDTVDAKIYSVLLDQFVQIYEGEDLTKFALQTLRKMINPLDFEGKERLLYMVNVEYYELIADWENYAKNVQLVIADQNITDENLLNEFAWKFYLHLSDPALLQAAIDGLSPCMASTQNASTMDTYASLLYRTGDVKKAIEWEHRAVHQAKSDMEDLLHYQLQLDKFENAN